MKKLCVIPCGRKKIWDHAPNAGPTIAKEAYIGVFHRLCQSYASHYFDDWVILSAKHGFLMPYDIVPANYDVSFSMNNEEVISKQLLGEQITKKKLDPFNQIVMLGGKKYQPIIKEVFQEKKLIEFPLTGTRGIGEMQQRLKTSLANRQPLHTTHIVNREEK